MRILHVTQPTDGGTANVVRTLAAAGVRAGHDVRLAAPADRELEAWCGENGVTWFELPLRRNPELRDLWLLGRLRRMYADADVAHLHSSKAGAVGRAAAMMVSRRRRPRIYFTPHGWSWFAGGRRAALYRAVERLLGPVAQAVVCVSTGELADGRSVLGTRAHLVLIPNGVDAAVFSPEGPTASRSALPLVVQVGRLSEQKAQDRSIRALAELDRRDVVLRLVGDGDSEVLRRLAEELDCSSRVQFIGHEDPRPHFRAADVVIFPSRWEGMALAMLEAMSIGSTIVATQVGGAEALDGVGVLVDHDQDDAEGAVIDRIVKELAELLDDPIRRERLSSAARERALDRYELSCTVAAYRDLWEG